jgi:ferredoxin
MNAILQVQTVFHLTGRPPAAPLEALGDHRLRPALLAAYRDLGRLRYDFPLVLLAPAEGGPVARSLTGVVNELASALAPAGPAGEALRKHLLHVEQGIRRATAAGATGMLSELWDQAVGRLTAREEFREILAGAGRALPAEGEVADCDPELPRKLFRHAWRVVQQEKARRVRADLDGMIVRLNDILRADFVGSEAGRTPESLRAAIGTGQQGLFNFDIMAKLLAGGARGGGLPEARRRRIVWALSMLRTQRFFPGAAGEDPHEFEFETCRGALQAYRERGPEMADLIRAMAVAELESAGRYDESRHDAFIAGLVAESLAPQDTEIFPDYLVCLRGRPADAAADTNLMQLLSSGIPVKVLVETDDILEEASAAQGRYAFGVRSVQLASLAIGLNDAFVLQSASANLLQMQAGIRKGMTVPRPALFSVYNAGAAAPGGLPLYLVSAAAMQSRAFPSFIYDPAAGDDLAARFSLEDNPQPEQDWPTTSFSYADGALQRISATLAFTLADFVITDPRYAHHFASVPHAAWNAQMVPLAEWLGSVTATEDGRVPCVAAVDEDDVLRYLVIDHRLVQATHRCLENWHRLQELGGIRNSHAQRLLARERAAWEAEKQAELAAHAGAPVAAAATSAEPRLAAAADPIVVEEPPERSPDDPWIETFRCSSCNECIEINAAMFAYDDNKQAYIRDLASGTYRQMIEAAESCQLSIIHPGRPLNDREAGLEELLERARPFQ